MNNGPISVSAPGTSLIGASSKDITFNTRYPFAKLDSTNPVSFQVITLFFNTEPPNPSAGNTNKTLIYSFAHGYNYEPSTWFLVSTDNFSSVIGTEGVWLFGNSTTFGSAYAILNIEVDTTNVNFYISKFTSTSPVVNPDIIGYSVSIRSYIFVEDLSGGSVPSHA